MAENNHIIDNSNDRRYYTQLPNIIDDSGLSVYAVRLYLHIKRVAGESGLCYQSIRTIGKVCKMGKSTVSRAKQELEEKGFISIKKNISEAGEYETDNITINDVWLENSLKYAGVPTRDTVSPTQTTGVPVAGQGVPDIALKKNPIKNNPKKNNSTALHTNVFLLAQSLADVTGMVYELNSGHLLKEASMLSSVGATPEQVRKIYGERGDWYLDDWRGSKLNQRPTPPQIRETWGKYNVPHKEPEPARPMITPEFMLPDYDKVTI